MLSNTQYTTKDKSSPNREKSGVLQHFTIDYDTMQNLHRSPPKEQLQVRFLLGVLAKALSRAFVLDGLCRIMKQCKVKFMATGNKSQKMTGG